jgi:hypothetical protein
MAIEYKKHLHDFLTAYLNTSGQIRAWKNVKQLWLAQIEISDCPQYSIGVKNISLKSKF